jgi:transcriptional antiterminator RfaH
MHWHCIHTRPQKEARVVAYLQETLALETYFPRLQRQKTIRRVRRVVTGPLFPRYLFCRFDLAQSFRAVRYGPDVIDLVTFGPKPAVVDDALIAGLKEWAGETVDIITLLPDLRAGDDVQVTDGPMQGLQAVILEERSDRDRVAVLLSILGAQVQMMISRSQLTRVQ